MLSFGRIIPMIILIGMQWHQLIEVREVPDPIAFAYFSMGVIALWITYFLQDYLNSKENASQIKTRTKHIN